MFEPTPLGFSIQNAESGTDESHARQWHVDKAAFSAAGGDIVATSSTESADAAAPDHDWVTVGEIKRGQGTIRIAGALLPQPTNEFDHPFGIEPYAVTYSGYILACNLIDCRVREGRPDRGCVPAGRARLGRKRARQRRALGGRLISRRGGIDRYCAKGGGVLRIGYPTKRLNRRVGRGVRRKIAKRAQLVLTTSKRLKLRGLRRGARVKALKRKLRGERRVRVGRNVWYLASSKKARLVFKTRGGRVRELGRVSKRLTRGKRASRRLLSAWRF
jgi:hypothetical protein